MNSILRHITLLVLIITATGTTLNAVEPIKIEGTIMAGGGKGHFAPYYIASNNHGILTQANNILASVGAFRSMNPTKRFSYEWGLEVYGGYSSSVNYMKYSGDGWTDVSRHPARFWLQQAYGSLRYRSLFLTAGMKNAESALLNNRLSSGDLVEGPNARPIPQIRVGFIDFQPIPFTNGWVEIQGEISYGKTTDKNWIKDHYNYYNDHICTGSWYTYKRCYLRSKSSQPLSVTVGMQTAGFFGGTTETYDKGVLTSTIHNKSGIKEFFKMFIPTEGDEAYYLGSTLGSWDINLRYRLPQGHIIKAYMHKPWETGSGIGFCNGFDGLWGIEYKAPEPGIISGAVIEYLDFTNQSGSIHFDPDDINTPIAIHTNGGDDYYNNYNYNAYANYGMSLGTPFLRSPIYNTDGYMGYVDNCVRGFHAAITGDINSRLSYRLLGGYRKGWGAIRQPRTVAVHDTSMMLEAAYIPPFANNALKTNIALAFDRGTMYGNTFGVLVSIIYSTNIMP